MNFFSPQFFNAALSVVFLGSGQKYWGKVTLIVPNYTRFFFVKNSRFQPENYLEQQFFGKTQLSFRNVIRWAGSTFKEIKKWQEFSLFNSNIREMTGTQK